MNLYQKSKWPKIMELIDLNNHRRVFSVYPTIATEYGRNLKLLEIIFPFQFPKAYYPADKYIFKNGILPTG